MQDVKETGQTNTVVSTNDRHYDTIVHPKPKYPKDL
jgi:hypothetical protein